VGCWKGQALLYLLEITRSQSGLAVLDQQETEPMAAILRPSVSQLSAAAAARQTDRARARLVVQGLVALVVPGLEPMLVVLVLADKDMLAALVFVVSLLMVQLVVEVAQVV
jgi:hypothetical protein